MVAIAYKMIGNFRRHGKINEVLKENSRDEYQISGMK